ncbi:MULTISPECIES: holo-ACP synthase [unclassified Rheinheimera]|jgi:holo-[acyl-carrier protein] synthase|uniref:holo-ACP synthase n=1 Tax=unclassified Rheinheimera TaxID=115860 RepID=UPI0008C770C4|nr:MULTISPECIES: holo-ACP synthase [unclassified Rheinheimera]MBU0912373.1 holo-ACP synthase [Gammaproteobacteria bacterium]OGO78452.1 MAG: holo-ACP synthase [Chromatiales bacterium RIFOXYA1_FULL_46_5]CAI3790646.1 Holo-[acyl-carrier-protein] synthase [Rheinheimera sp. MM224]HJS14445.1 holo-ACP synthase [Rheinheimera sp.]
MAIVGLGTDIIEIARIEQSLTRSPRLVQRVLTESEQQILAAHGQPARYFAKRFAAKEAAAKALGTGIGRGISFQHFIVSNDPSGRPQLELTGPAKALADSMQVRSVWLSISDEQAYACATVILES